MASDVFSVSFVCTGNICRSPMAEIVFRTLAEQAGIADSLRVTSAGTGDWHLGERADQRTIAALERRGFDGTGHRARKFETGDFGDLDLIVALDRSHERVLHQWAPSRVDRDKVGLLLSFDPAQAALQDVPDPYYADDAVFDAVLGMIEGACGKLFRQIQPAIRQGAPR